MDSERLKPAFMAGLLIRALKGVAIFRLRFVLFDKLTPYTGPMVHDARIAALCVALGVRELWSTDRGVSRFLQPTVRNPLIG